MDDQIPNSRPSTSSSSDTVDVASIMKQMADMKQKALAGDQASKQLEQDYQKLKEKRQRRSLMKDSLSASSQDLLTAIKNAQPSSSSSLQGKPITPESLEVLEAQLRQKQEIMAAERSRRSSTLISKRVQLGESIPLAFGGGLSDYDFGPDAGKVPMRLHRGNMTPEQKAFGKQVAQAAQLRNKTDGDDVKQSMSSLQGEKSIKAAVKELENVTRMDDLKRESERKKDISKNASIETTKERTNSMPLYVSESLSSEKRTMPTRSKTEMTKQGDSDFAFSKSIYEKVPSNLIDKKDALTKNDAEITQKIANSEPKFVTMDLRSMSRSKGEAGKQGEIDIGFSKDGIEKASSTFTDKKIITTKPSIESDTYSQSDSIVKILNVEERSSSISPKLETTKEGKPDIISSKSILENSRQKSPILSDNFHDDSDFKILRNSQNLSSEFSNKSLSSKVEKRLSTSSKLEKKLLKPAQSNDNSQGRLDLDRDMKTQMFDADNNASVMKQIPFSKNEASENELDNLVSTRSEAKTVMRWPPPKPSTLKTSQQSKSADGEVKTSLIISQTLTEKKSAELRPSYGHAMKSTEKKSPEIRPSYGDAMKSRHEFKPDVSEVLISTSKSKSNPVDNVALKLTCEPKSSDKDTLKSIQKNISQIKASDNEAMNLPPSETVTYKKSHQNKPLETKSTISHTSMEKEISGSKLTNIEGKILPIPQVSIEKKHPQVRLDERKDIIKLSSSVELTEKEVPQSDLLDEEEEDEEDDDELPVRVVHGRDVSTGTIRAGLPWMMASLKKSSKVPTKSMSLSTYGQDQEKEKEMSPKLNPVTNVPILQTDETSKMEPIDKEPIDKETIEHMDRDTIEQLPPVRSREKTLSEDSETQKSDISKDDIIISPNLTSRSIHSPIGMLSPSHSGITGNNLGGLNRSDSVQSIASTSSINSGRSSGSFVDSSKRLSTQDRATVWEKRGSGWYRKPGPKDQEYPSDPSDQSRFSLKDTSGMSSTSPIPFMSLSNQETDQNNSNRGIAIDIGGNDFSSKLGNIMSRGLMGNHSNQRLNKPMEYNSNSNTTFSSSSYTNRGIALPGLAKPRSIETDLQESEETTTSISAHPLSHPTKNRVRRPGRS